MVRQMNKVIISGRLTADPEVRYTQAGKCVVGFTLAVDRGFGDNKTTSFIPCTAWEKKAELIGNTLTKGRKLLIVGEWSQRSWEDKEGKKRRTDECIVSDFEYGDNKKTDEQINDVAGSMGTVVDDDESIPF
jgi:single-strand DNA-binding protein